VNTSTITKELQPLAEEAKKFKTAEEFIESVPTDIPTKTGESVLLKSFHGTDKSFDKFKITEKGVRYSGDGVYFTPSKEGAKHFAGDKGRVIESYLDLKKPYTRYLPEGNSDLQFGNDFINEIKSKGFDSLIVRMRDVDTITKKVEADWINEIVVFDTSVIKTKPQLVDFFSKINKK
jgi:hypothetical protein